MVWIIDFFGFAIDFSNLSDDIKNLLYAVVVGYLLRNVTNYIVNRKIKQANKVYRSILIELLSNKSLKGKHIKTIEEALNRF